MKTVILAEKPNQAKAYAAAFEVAKQEQTHIELKPCSTFPSGATITWGIGHLVELELPGAYDEKWEKWNLANLPVMPQQYRFKVGASKKAQFAAVKKLLQEADVLINACDIDREGSNIFYLILKVANVTNKQIKRLWINSMEPEEIQKGFNNLRDNKLDYLMHQEAYARMISDWLVGMNGSPLYSLLLQQKGMQGVLSVGRCQSPLVMMIYEREKSIKNFKPTPFYELVANLTTSSQQTFKAKAVGFKVTSRDELNAFLLEKRLAPNIPVSAKVAKVETTLKSTQSPKLHSLSTLQAAANKKWKYSPKMVLDIMQKLYEAKLLTYPRTDTNYITEAEFDYLALNIVAYQHVAGVNFHANITPNKRYVDNSKVQEHFAIIPTKTATNANKIAELAEPERNVFNEVLHTTLAMFHKPYEYKETKIITMINDVEFAVTGRVEVDKGWKSLFGRESVPEDEKEAINVLPSVKENDVLEAIVSELEGVTKPPKPFTEGQLIDLMKTAGKTIDNEEDAAILKEVEGIGTEATRASIIETVKQKEYITVQKNIVSVTPKGEVLCQALADSLVGSPMLTARWESKLRTISSGEMTAEAFLKDIEQFIRDMIQKATAAVQSNTTLDTAISNSQTVSELGTCPVCQKGQMIDRKTFISCNEYKNGCKFNISRTIAKKKVTDKNVQDLLTKGKTAVIKGFTSTKNTKFDAALVVKEGKIQFEFAKK